MSHVTSHTTCRSNRTRGVGKLISLWQEQGDLLQWISASRRVDWSCWRGSFEFARWWWSPLPSAPAVGVLDWQNYQGGTRGSRLCGEDRNWETENSKVCARTGDTRFIQVRVAKVANPTSCLGYQVWRPALGVGWDQVPGQVPGLPLCSTGGRFVRNRMLVSLRGGGGELDNLKP
jgi:hypothetical protein